MLVLLLRGGVWLTISANGIYTGVNGIDSSREFARWNGVYKGTERKLGREILSRELGNEDAAGPSSICVHEAYLINSLEVFGHRTGTKPLSMIVV